MNDIIRKAVELADGWRAFGGMEVEGWDYCAPHQQDDNHLLEMPQGDKDALAAQLCRQCDEAGDGGPDVIIHSERTHVGMPKQDWQSCGNGRTMNTIKAIVDSGVLK